MTTWKVRDAAYATAIVVLSIAAALSAAVHASALLLFALVLLIAAVAVGGAELEARRRAVARAPALRYRRIVVLSASPAVRRRFLAAAGIPDPGGPALEYHIRPGPNGASAVRAALADARLAAAAAQAPSVHMMAWRGATVGMLDRILRKHLRLPPGSQVRVWRSGVFAAAVVVICPSGAIARGGS